ncbi:MAG: Gfo/Idh/MocA family protein [Actinomycetota bacterium]
MARMIQVAVIGAGRWGPNLIRNFHNRETSQVVWVVDRDRSRLEQVAARFPDIALSEQEGPAFLDPRVEAVVVAASPSGHHALARAALKAGKHVLVEKPFTSSVRQAEELCALAEAASLVLMAGHVFVYNPAVQEVKRYLDSGVVGPIYYLSMVRTNLGDIRPDVNALWDLAPHDISIADYWLAGGALSASAVGGTWINSGLEDAVFATLRYPDNVLVHLNISWLNPRKVRHVTVVGEKKMITFDDMDLTEPVRIYDKQVTGDASAPSYVDTFVSFRSSIREGDVIIPRVGIGEPLKAECDHFTECIVTGLRPVTSGQDGLQVVRTLEAIQRSLLASGAEQPVR